jgi:hypothetical protein
VVTPGPLMMVAKDRQHLRCTNMASMDINHHNRRPWAPILKTQAPISNRHHMEPFIPINLLGGPLHNGGQHPQAITGLAQHLPPFMRWKLLQACHQQAPDPPKVQHRARLRYKRSRWDLLPSLLDPSPRTWLDIVARRLLQTLLIHRQQHDPQLSLRRHRLLSSLQMLRQVSLQSVTTSALFRAKSRPRSSGRHRSP